MKTNLKSIEKIRLAKVMSGPWHLSRKVFVKSMIAGGILSQLPFKKIVGQQDNQEKLVITPDQSCIIESVQNILFPDDGNGPGAKSINAKSYLEWVIADLEKDPEEVKYIIDGIGWVNETSEETYSKPFKDLNSNEKEILIKKVSNESWGESWLSVIMSLIFEALLCDPQYGGNPGNIGWNWLNHNPGQPRPGKELLYPEILQTTK